MQIRHMPDGIVAYKCLSEILQKTHSEVLLYLHTSDAVGTYEKLSSFVLLKNLNKG